MSTCTGVQCPAAKLMNPNQLRYHLKELKIARDPNSPSHSMPEFEAHERVFLDIGCGIGQTFVASQPPNQALLVGIDTDLEGLSYGRDHFGHIRYMNATAEQLPFRDGAFDVVISRVSLPYTDLARSLVEIFRVLKPDGRLWATLHPLSLTVGELVRAVRKLRVKEILFRLYVIANGLAFDMVGKQFPFPWNGRYESFQSVRSIRRSLTRAGFSEINLEDNRRITVTARKQM